MSLHILLDLHKNIYVCLRTYVDIHSQIQYMPKSSVSYARAGHRALQLAVPQRLPSTAGIISGLPAAGGGGGGGAMSASESTVVLAVGFEETALSSLT